MRRIWSAAGAAAGTGAIAILAIGAFGAASAAELRGRISIPAAPPHVASPNAYPGQLSAEHEAAAAHRMDVTPEDAVVSLEPVSGAVPAGARAPRPGVRAALRQSHQMFEPRVLPILVGSVVDFPNDDPFYHNVFSYSSTKRFDLGRYGKGKSQSQTFDRPGLVKVFCDIHSDMAAFIVVLDTPYFVTPAADGKYAVPNVPPGEYAVSVWHPDLAEWKGTVTIPADSVATLDVEMR